MKIKQTNLNIVYPQIEEYRKKFINSEDILNEYFLPPTMLPVPNEVQGEIPRIIVQTKNGHSVLNIALTVASFTTNYNNNFTKNWELCKDYLENRGTCVYNMIDNMNDEKNIFVGLVTNIEMNDLDEDGLNVLKKSLLKENTADLGDIYDLGFKFTYVYKEKYYINITLENFRDFETKKNEGGRNCIRGEKKHTISASIDINDRYASNYNPEYKSGKEEFEEIIRITSNIIDNKLDDLIRKGEFVYE